MRTAIPLALVAQSFFASLVLAETASVPFVSLKGYDLKKSHVIQNLPPTTDQGSLPWCFAHAAATVFNYYVCRDLKQDCSRVPRNELASPLDITRYTVPPGESDILDYVSSYPDINIASGSAIVTLEISALFVGTVASQACAPQEEFFIGTGKTGKGIGTEVVLSQTRTVDQLKAFYTRYAKGCDEQCITLALDELGKVLPNYKTDGPTLSRALKKESFSGFITRLAIPNTCALAKNRSYFESDDYSMNVAPKTAKEKLSYARYSKELVNAIKQDNPVIIEGICLTPKKNGQCAEMHALVAYGYAQLCDVNECRTGLKLRSSWGEDWQRAADDLWYDAESLYNASSRAETALGWLSKKPKQ